MNPLKQKYEEKKEKWGKLGEKRAGFTYIEKDKVSKTMKNKEEWGEWEKWNNMIRTILLY